MGKTKDACWKLLEEHGLKRAVWESRTSDALYTLLTSKISEVNMIRRAEEDLAAKLEAADKELAKTRRQLSHEQKLVSEHADRVLKIFRFEDLPESEKASAIRDCGAEHGWGMDALERFLAEIPSAFREKIADVEDRCKDASVSLVDAHERIETLEDALHHIQNVASSAVRLPDQETSQIDKAERAVAAAKEDVLAAVRDFDAREPNVEAFLSTRDCLSQSVDKLHEAERALEELKGKS